MTTRFVFVFAITLNVLAMSVSGQEQIANQESAQPANETLTQILIQNAISQAQQKEGVDEATKVQTIELYAQALQVLTSAEEWSAKARDFRSALDNAPQLTVQIQQELLKPPSTERPDVAADAILSDLELALARARMQLLTAQKSITDLEAESGRRNERIQQLPELLANARMRLTQVQSEVVVAADPGDVPDVVEARKVLRRARELAVAAEVEAYENEFLSYEVRGRLLSLRQDQASRAVNEQERLVKARQEEVTTLRRRQALRAAEEARQAVLQAAEVTPGIRDTAEKLAQDNADLMERRTGPEGLLRALESSAREIETVERVLKQVQADFASVRERVEMSAAGEALGPLLRRQAEGLPDIGEIRSNRLQRQAMIAVAQVARLDLRNDRAMLRDPELAVANLLEEVQSTISGRELRDLQRILREQVQTKRDTIDALLSEYDTYFQQLSALDVQELELRRTVEEFQDFIARHSLWLRSTEAFGLKDLSLANTGLQAIGSFSLWKSVGRLLRGDVMNHWLLYVLAVVPVIFLLSIARRVRDRVESAKVTVKKKASTNFLATVEVLAYTTLYSCAFVWLPWFLGWRLAQVQVDESLIPALGSALMVLSLYALPTVFAALSLADIGLGSNHFGWPLTECQKLRRRIRWFLPLSATFVGLQTWANVAEFPDWSQSFGRICLTLVLITFALFIGLILRPRRGGLAGILGFNESSRTRKSTVFAMGVAQLLLLSLAVAALGGYYFTAIRIGTNALYTLGAAGGLYLLFRLGERWLLVTKRRMKKEQLRKKSRDNQKEPPDFEEIAEIEDVVRIDVQTRKLLLVSVWITMLAFTFLLWKDELPALQALESVDLWEVTETRTETITNTEGNETLLTSDALRPITLFDLGQALVIVAFGLAMIYNAPGFIELAILRNLKVGAGESYAITTLLKYVLTVLVIVWAFAQIGVGWSQVQWLVAALSLGLGFGLQEIFANFVSGLILLFERPVRVGDIITIGGQSGKVTKIKIRATSIRDFDKKELIVPNKDLITGQLLNWTLSDAVLRIVIPIGIAYGSDTERAEGILWKILNSNPLVLKDPAPQVFFLNFGDNSLLYEIRAFSSSADNVLPLRHELNKAIDSAFREAGIEISFPQRDLHIREPLQFVQVQPDATQNPQSSVVEPKPFK